MPTAPLDTVETILNVARARLNDMIQSQGGDVLTDNQPFTTVMFNAAYRRLQRGLASLGYLLFEQETILTGLPAVYGTVPDPGTQVWIDWTGYWDGNSLNTAFFLPQWFLSPLDLWERISGLPTPPQFLDMDMIVRGMPAVQQTSWNQIWEWKNNRIYMPGALGLTDLRVRGASFLADFTDISAAGGSAQIVPILQCEDPFANLVCSEMANSRGDLDGKSFDTKADAGIALIAARDLQQPRALAKVSEVGKMPDRLSPGYAQNQAPIQQPTGGQ